MTDKRETPTSIWARRYIERFGLALVSIEPREKMPKGLGWNQPGGYFTDASAAEQHWHSLPEHNMGVVLGPSRVCSLDVDDMQWTRFVLHELLGVDLDQLVADYPTIVGHPERCRLMFRVPEGVDLNRHALSWPHEDDPDGSRFKALMEAARSAKAAGDVAGEAEARAEADEIKRFTVVELRAGLVQDVLPPSIHPGTGKPYAWKTAPGADLPILPQALLAMWLNWEAFKRDAVAACPWAPKTETRSSRKAEPGVQSRTGGAGESVIDAFNRAHDVESLLSAHGYERRGRKWLCPNSSSGLPGVTISDGKVYSHHASDPLANDHQNDAFDVFCILEHGGDAKAATRAAAKALGMEREPSPQLPRAPSDPERGSSADEGAGEGLTAGQVLRRFALIEGTTGVWDQDAKRSMKKTAFELLVGKPLAREWSDETSKMLISADVVRELEQARKLKGKKDGLEGMAPVDRYVYIDGTKDVWDRQKKRRVAEGAVKMALGDAYTLWLNSPQRRVVDVDHIVFDPTMTKDPSVYINTFEGLPLTPERDDAACANLRWLISFLCNRESADTEWLTKWLAYPLQHPGAKMDTAVLAHSTTEGSGKSLLFADVLGALYGQYAAVVGQTQLESSFNAWQSGKLWAVFEEVVSRDQRYNQVGKIKHLITGKTVRMESKFINGWEEANHMNAVFLSNEILPWPISDSDRRMLVLWPAETLPEERQKAISRELADGGVAALYAWLLSVNLDDFDQRTRPPRTAARQRLVALSRSAWQTFLAQWQSGELGEGVLAGCLSADLYALFAEWCHRNKEHTMSHTKFSQFISTEIEKTDRSIPWNDGTRRRFGFFFFPPEDEDASPAPSRDAAGLGRMVEEWRKRARLAGWNVDAWDHVKGYAA